MTDKPILSIKDLYVQFNTEEGVVKAVNGVSYDCYKGKTLAVVGESGCGKSVTSMSILRLIPMPPGKITKGEILFEDQDILKLPDEKMRNIRGNEIAIIFQEPMTALNPVYTIGQQIIEAVELHLGKKGAAARQHAIDMLVKVGISAPQQRIDAYPHQLSGGMRQRVMIAMALCCDPALLIADEPTTALDVTIQAQILDLIKDLQRTNGMSVVLITHDLAVVAENADDVCVMYASKVVEQTDVHKTFSRPLHPYTKGLLNSLPRMDKKLERLEVIPGSVPNPLHFPDGCKFHTRCPYCKDDQKCMTQEPTLEEIEPGHWVACWKVKAIQAELDNE